MIDELIRRWQFKLNPFANNGKKEYRHSGHRSLDQRYGGKTGRIRKRRSGDNLPHFDEVISSLKKEKWRSDRVNSDGNDYEITTAIDFDSRDWHYNSIVQLNGREITDDSKLNRNEHTRKRVAQPQKAKALWDFFLKEAARIHLEKCSETQNRFHKTDKRYFGMMKKAFSNQN